MLLDKGMLGCLIAQALVFYSCQEPTPITEYPSFNTSYKDSILFSSDRESNQGTNKLFMMYKDGSGMRGLTEAGYVLGFCWSPGKWKIAYVHEENGVRWPRQDLNVMDCNGLNSVQISVAGELVDGGLSWSPDGQSIAYIERDTVGLPTTSYGLTRVKTIRPDGTGPRAVTPWLYRAYETAWTHDSKHVIFAQEGKFFKVSKDSSEATLFLDNCYTPRISPDGEYLGFNTGSFSGAGTIHLLSLRDGGIHPIDDGYTIWDGPITWSPNSREIIYAGVRRGKNMGEIFAIEINGANFRRITYDTLHVYRSPRWYN
jgi:Tol biopolymer transport system component